MMKKMALVMASVAALGLAACDRNDADVVSENIKVAADNFEVNRRIVFYNSISSEYLLVIEGLCSLGNNDTALA
jgi:outer membrane lipoprotein SlyB